jgi:hypothetical protein
MFRVVTVGNCRRIGNFPITCFMMVFLPTPAGPTNTNSTPVKESDSVKFSPQAAIVTVDDRGNFTRSGQSEPQKAG